MENVNRVSIPARYPHRIIPLYPTVRFPGIIVALIVFQEISVFIPVALLMTLAYIHSACTKRENIVCLPWNYNISFISLLIRIYVFRLRKGRKMNVSYTRSPRVFYSNRFALPRSRIALSIHVIITRLHKFTVENAATEISMIQR